MPGGISRRTVGAIAASLVLAFVSSAIADDATLTRYRQLVAAAKANPSAVNFSELRSAYVKSGLYKGDGSDPMSFFLTKPIPARVSEFVDDNFAIVGTHLYVLSTYPVDAPERAMHTQALARIVAAMIARTDGKSPESAIRILTVSEEYDLIRLLKLAPRGQALITQNGIPYDRMSVASTSAGAEPIRFELWFDLTDLFAANRATMSPAPPQAPRTR
jgi:hypothetical protein